MDKIYRALISLIFLSIVFAFACAAQTAAVKASKIVRLRGNVLAVEDADRIKVAADDGNVYSAVLIGVDAPDEKQSYYKKAKKRLAELTEGKEVTLMLRTYTDGRAWAVVYAGAEDIGLRLIQDGLAWFAPNRSASQTAADRENYVRAESAAKSAKSGLWNDDRPVAPWEFRGERLESLEVSPSNTPVETPRRSEPVPGRTYILGPRGGCYYLNDQGMKVYVKDKTLCQKP